MAKKPGLEQRSVGLEDSTWDWLDKLSVENDRSVSAQIRRFLSKCKRELEAKKP